MSDFIGRIAVPSPVVSGLTWPLTPDFGYGTTRPWPTITHHFGEFAGKAYQTFQVGVGPRKFPFKRATLNYQNRQALWSFFESVQGAYQQFIYNAPQPDKSTTAYNVIFESAPVTVEELANACRTGFNFVECPSASSAPSYSVASTCLRFPSGALQAALLSQVQQIIPLVHIRLREGSSAPQWQSGTTYAANAVVNYGATPVPYVAIDSNAGNEPDISPAHWRPFDIYLSDRRCTVGGQLYLPRVLGMGEPGLDVLMSQDIKGTADNVQFTFGNADRVMTALANDTDLKYASIDLSLYHVNSEILIQLWKGFVISFVSDGSSQFVTQCSDGLYQVTQQYPNRTISRTCWKTFNDGVNCPYSTQGSGGGATCSYYFTTPYVSGDPTQPGGCTEHEMTPYFGGHQADPQGVNIKDNTTGVFGIGRNTVTATSIVSDTIYGQALPDIWCNDGGSPINAFYANALMMDVRDEGDYFDGLGIIGSGPIGTYEGMTVATNADGYKFIVAPMMDGFPPQGFKVDGQLNIIGFQPTLGLREVMGNDPANPATDSFSLGQGTPQTWGTELSAGTAFVELRYLKPSGIAPSTPEQHQMTVPLAQGLTGWTWDGSGTRAAKPGLTNPFWIAVNTYLRAIGLSDAIPTPPNSISIPVNLPPSSFFGFSGAFAGVFIAGLVIGNPIALIAGLVGLIGGAFTGNAFSVPMSNAANQAEAIMRQNVYGWQNLSPFYKTTANRSTYAANFDTIWNAYVSACTVIFQGDPNGSDAKKALNRSIGDRQRGGKFDWYAAYRDPIANDATPGDSLTPFNNSNVQLETFVLSSLFVGDGSGTAEIADAVVPQILGTGAETQFQFQGTIAQQKPVRDWLTEILNCGLGYFTFEFGKLKLGIRENASAIEAFTVGNILYQSLKLTPIESTFEHLILDFADVAYQFQANTAEYQDKDHAAYYGRAGSPLTSRMHSLGSSTLSQTLRLAATRTREEIGGVNATEWKNARNASWSTTILALNTEVGQVVSMTHPDVPTGTGNFRIQRWRLMKDWSLQIDAKTVTTSMYDLDVGPKPIDVKPQPLPALFYPIPQGEWAPFQIQAPSTDALFPGEYTFDASQNYTMAAPGSPLATVVVTGKLPVNQFLSGCGAPTITGGSITQSTTGGAIPGGITLRVSVCANDGNGLSSPPSFVLLVQIPPGTNTNQLTISDITWPAVTGLIAYTVFVSPQDDLICAQQTGVLTADGTGIAYSPTSITVAGPFTRSTWGLPNPSLTKVRVKGKRLIRGGVEGAIIDSVSGNVVVSGETIDVAGTDNWAGRTIAVIGRAGGSAPYASFNVTAFNPATGAFTLTQDAAAAGVTAGDVFVICFLGYDNYASPYTFTDAGLSNAANYDPVTLAPNPHTGLVVNSDQGLIARVIAGTSRGSTANVVSNAATAYTFDVPLVLDATSVLTIEEKSWSFSVDSDTVTNANILLASSINLPTNNFLRKSMLIGAVTVDDSGNESDDSDAPVRMLYVFGAGGTRVVSATTTMLPTDGMVVFDSITADAIYTCLPFSQLPNQLFIIYRRNCGSFKVTVQAVGLDLFQTGTNFIILTDDTTNYHTQFKVPSA